MTVDVIVSRICAVSDSILYVGHSCPTAFGDRMILGENFIVAATWGGIAWESGDLGCAASRRLQAVL